MMAAVLRQPAPIDASPLQIEEVPVPEVRNGMALLKVLACGVCRTDLHIVEGDLPKRTEKIIPGHQIVGEVISAPNSSHQVGDRVGVSWIGGTDGTCRYCKSGKENLCDSPVFTGYTHDGGYAEYALARTDFLLPIPQSLAPESAAPLLCAGIIGYRSLKMAEVRKGQRVGLFGFGSSAQVLMRVLNAWDCEVYVSTRQARHREIAKSLGAEWVGDALAVPPVGLDSAITFAPSGDVVIAALRSVAKGGIVAINAIHLDRIPQFDYDSLLWGERQLRSVTNMTRQDAMEFLKLADEIKLQPQLQQFTLRDANKALTALKEDDVASSAVIVP
jgi:propanol-preferring alcohol dehydrogenase